MPTSFSHIVLRLFTFPLLLLQLLQNPKNIYLYFCYCYYYYHTTFATKTLLQILSYPGVVELTTQLLILNNILWLPLCWINKFGLNTLPSKAVVIPYTCGLSTSLWTSHPRFYFSWNIGSPIYVFFLKKTQRSILFFYIRIGMPGPTYVSLLTILYILKLLYMLLYIIVIVIIYLTDTYICKKTISHILLTYKKIT